MPFFRPLPSFCSSVLATALLDTLVSLAVSSTAVAQLPSGTPDPTFPAASSRISVAVPSPYNLEASDLAEGPNGSLWLAGKWRQTSTVSEALVTKLTAAGAVDTTYGTQGSVRLDPLNVQTDPFALAPMADGQMLVAIGRSTGLVVKRLTVQGTQDMTFGTGGEAFISRGTAVRPGAMLVEPDGKIVVAAVNETNGSTIARTLFIVRLLPNGSRDTTFGAPAYGPGIMDLSNTAFVPDQARGLYRKADGTFLVAGTIDHPSYSGVEIAHLESNGRVDFFHGYQGIASNMGLGLVQIRRVRIDHKGLWVLGRTSNVSNTVLMRLTHGCSLDPTFSGDGRILVQNDSVSTDARDVVQRSDGRLFVVGQVYSTTSGYISGFVRCYRPDGIPEAAFGVLHNIAASTAFMGLNRVILDSDNRLLVAGARYEGALPLPLPAPPSYGVARYGTSSLQVNTPPAFVTLIPDQTMQIGTVRSLDVRVAPNTLVPWYKWTKNGQVITGRPSLNPVQAADEGTYTVEVGNYAGSITQNFTLTVYAPPIIISQPSLSYNGDKAVITLVIDGRRPLSVQWQRWGSPYDSPHVPELITGTDTLILPRSASYAADYRCVITNAEGSVTSEVVHYEPPHDYPVVVESPPPEEILAWGGRENIEVTVIGRPPMTFQWLRDGVAVGTPQVAGTDRGYAERVTDALYIPARPEFAGVYQCRITNAYASVTTVPVPMFIHAGPVVLMDPPRQILRTGEPLEIGFRTYMDPLPKGVYLLKNKAKFADIPLGIFIAHGRTAFHAHTATLSSAGTYQAVVQPVTGSRLIGDAMTVAVVDSSAQRVVARTGGTATLNVQTAGAGLYLTWRRMDGQPLTGQRFSGLHSRQLKITQVSAADAADYVCDVVWGTVHGPTVTSGVTSLQVATQRPRLVPQTLPSGVVLAPYSATLNITGYPARVTAAGLPRGLTLNPDTLAIGGRPLEVGTFNVRIYTSNVWGASAPVTLPLIITPIPAYAVGSYVAELNIGDAVGTMQMTVDGSGVFTARASLPMGKGKFRVLVFAGQLSHDLDGTLKVEAATRTSGSGITGRLGDTSILAIQCSPLQQYVEARILDDVGSIELDFYKRAWHAVTNPAIAHAGYSTVALSPRLNDSACGSGYGGLTVKDSGDVTFAGRMPDGTAFTAAGFLSAFQVGGQTRAGAYLYTSLYQAQGHLSGVLWGCSAAATDHIEGTLSWRRPKTQPVMEGLGDSFGTGFLTSVDVMGSLYLPPAQPGVTTPYMLNATPPARIVGTIAWDWYAHRSPIVFTGDLSLKHILTTPLYVVGEHFHITRLTFQPKKGLWSGSGTYYHYNFTDNPAQTPPRSRAATTFYGATVRLSPETSNVGTGLGFFIHPSTISSQSPPGSRLEGGSVRLELAP